MISKCVHDGRTDGLLPSSLVELVRKNVFIVGQGDDELDHQFSISGDDSPVGSEIGVLPSNAVVLFVDTDHVLGDGWLAFRVDQHCVDVFDHAETVATEREIVGSSPGPGVAEIERLLPVKRGAGIGVRNGHLGHAQPVQHASALIMNIMQDRTLPWSEATNPSVWAD